MEKKLLYCEKCGRFVKTRIQKREETLAVKGVDITLNVDTCTCCTCGTPVFSHDTDDDSLKQFYREYRRRMGLLQPEEIRAIRSKYGVSQETFAKVLGMGAKTIARYENGSLQDEAQNNLILLMRDFSNMRKLIELHPERLSRTERTGLLSKTEYNSSLTSSDAFVRGMVVDHRPHGDLFRHLRPRRRGLLPVQLLRQAGCRLRPLQRPEAGRR